MFTSRIPPSTRAALRSISQTPCPKRYSIDCFRYWIIAKMKNLNVLKGCLVSVKFSSSRWCFSWSPAKNSNSISPRNLMGFNKQTCLYYPRKKNPIISSCCRFYYIFISIPLVKKRALNVRWHCDSLYECNSKQYDFYKVIYNYSTVQANESPSPYKPY